MATPNPKGRQGKATKASVMAHMNTDHIFSLSLYLHHFCSLSSSDALSPRLTDMTFTSLIIECTPHSGARTTHTIPIAPPLTSWSEARPRLADMERTARSALGISPDGDAAAAPAAVVIDTYTPPREPLHVFMVCLVLFFYAGIWAQRHGWLAPGSWYWEHVMRRFPGGADAYVGLQEALAGPVAGLHAAETAWMVGRLRRHGVRFVSGLWWRWVGSTFLEGFGAHQRFGALVAVKEDERRSR